MEYYTIFPQDFIEEVNIEHQNTFEKIRIQKYRVSSNLVSLDDCIMKIRIDLNSTYLESFTLSHILKITIADWKLHLDPMFYMNGITIGIFKNDSYRWQIETENEAEADIAMNVERLLWDCQDEFITEYKETSN